MSTENPSYQEPLRHRFWNALTGKKAGSWNESPSQNQSHAWIDVRAYPWASDDIRKIPFSERSKMYASLWKRDIFRGSAEQNRYLKSQISTSPSFQKEVVTREYGQKIEWTTHASRNSRERLIQGVSNFTAPRRFDAQQTAQMIERTFWKVSSVVLPRSSGKLETAFKKSNGLFYFSWSNNPCFLEKWEQVSLNTNESRNVRSPKVRKVTSYVRKSVETNTEWSWESKNIFKRLFSTAKSQKKQPTWFPDYYNPQNQWDNCGATACSMVAAKLLGIDAEAFENKHTIVGNSNRSINRMLWTSPKRWLGPLGLSVREIPWKYLSMSELHQILQDPNKAVIASVTPKSWLTGGGHITALVGSKKTENGYTITNADPNYNNIRKWHGHISSDKLVGGGAANYWIVEKNSSMS